MKYKIIFFLLVNSLLCGSATGQTIDTTFVFHDTCECCEYWVAGDSVYFLGEVLAYADPRTFTCIAGNYAKDKNYVYLGSDTVSNVDPATFTVIKEGYCKDRNFVYYTIYSYTRNRSVLRKINGADPKTFEVLDLVMTKDKNSVYEFKGLESVIRMKLPDAKTFKTHSDLYYDKNYFYNVDMSVLAKRDTFNIYNIIFYPAEELAKTDSIFKIGDFAFAAPKTMQCELLKRGGRPLTKCKTDTLYKDRDRILLGDNSKLQTRGIYKKFRFKSHFEDFKVEGFYDKGFATPVFATNDKKTIRLKKQLLTAFENTNINFAGHYSIVEWRCGVESYKMAIVDRITGKVDTNIPFDNPNGHCGLEFKPGSRLIWVNTETLHDIDGYILDYRRKPAAYEFKNGRFIKIE